jgi:3-oxoacid CoA-transferase subunit A
MFEPTDLFLSGVDQSMVDKTMERYLGEIERNLNYRLWVFGHYHSTRTYPKIDNKQMLMLFNDKAIELEDWIKNDSGQFL